MNYYKVETVYDFMRQVFIKSGVPEDEATICADVLIASDLSGIESHGVGRLRMYYDRIKAGVQSAQTDIEILSDKAAISVWDGNHGMGQVISYRAMKEAIGKAKKFGISAIAVRNSTHYGIAGFYAKMAADEDMIGITVTNARPSIAPLFGVDPMLGTNPIAFGAPTDMEYPFLYDAATSISQRGKIEVLAREDKPTPPAWAIDRKAQPVTDSKQLLVDLLEKQAAMVGLGGTEEETGGHKGYGLAVMVEILSAALQNGSYLAGLHGYEKGKRVPYRLGHFFLAMDISAFTDIESFKTITSDILRELKQSQKAPGKDKIYVAGEKEFYAEKNVREQGIPVTENLKKDLEYLSKELHIPMIEK
jgi:LDH2 family malate/lactate/ureidoglycolate dehydrogenase